MKLDAFISILRDILLRYGNIEVSTTSKLGHTFPLTHEDIEIVNFYNDGEVIISVHKD